MSALYLAADHRGYHLKKRLLRYLENELHLSPVDLGPTAYDEKDDYPDYAIPLAQKVAGEKDAKGILICGSANGVCMAANKVKGIRAGIGYNIAAAESAMAHLNTNVLCISAELSTDEHAMAIVKKWLETPFSEEERHVRRLQKIENLEK